MAFPHGRYSLSILTVPTERLPNANRLPNHRPSFPSCRNLPHPLPHRHNLRPRKFPHQTSLLPSNIHPLRRHLPFAASDWRRYRFCSQPPGQEPQPRRSYHGCGIIVSGRHAADVSAAVFRFHDQDLKKDADDG